MTGGWSLAIDCVNPAKLAAFWALALEYDARPPPDGFGGREEWFARHDVPESEWGDGAYLFDPKGFGPNLSFLKVPEPKVGKNRPHIDVQAGGGRETPGEVRWPRVVEAAARLAAAVENRGCARRSAVLPWDS